MRSQVSFTQSKFERNNMKLHSHAARRPLTFSPAMLAGFALALSLATQTCAAQAQAAESKPAVASKQVVKTYQTIYLTNASQQSDLTDIQTAIRNMLSEVRIYGIPSQNAISIQGTPEDIALAQKIVSELDRPRKLYRLTFTITEIDGGKRTATQNYSLIAASGERSSLKQGRRVPIVTGKFDVDASAQNTQVQYQDVGLNIEATVATFAEGVRLRSKVEQSSLSDKKSGVGIQDPVLNQTVVDGTATLALGKPFVLGSLATPDSARTQEIAVVAELVR
jgi:type II secretory pathway component GspD/PulD (secretin)